MQCNRLFSFLVDEKKISMDDIDDDLSFESIIEKYSDFAEWMKKK